MENKENYYIDLTAKSHLKQKNVLKEKGLIDKIGIEDPYNVHRLLT